MSGFSKIRFALVGATAYGAHFLFVWIAGNIFISPVLVSILTFGSFFTVSVGSYFAHRHFTFISDANHIKSGLTFACVVLLGALFAAITSLVASHYFGNNWLVVAQIIFAVFWAVISAMLMSKFVF